MTTPVPSSEDRNVRALGWDVDSSFSGNSGEFLPIGSFGHTGFTGTSLWIDPATRMFVVFLSNRVHPDGKGDVTPLRARVATIAASAIDALPANLRTATLTGRDFGGDAAGSGQAAAFGGFRARCAARRAVCAAARQARRAGHQPHRPRPRRRDGHRSPVRIQGSAARRAVQSRARHSRRARRERAVGEGSEDRAGDPFAVRRDAAADRGDARWARRASSSTCRTSARGSTPTSRPWPSSWKRPRSGTCRCSCSIGRIQSTVSRSRVRRLDKSLTRVHRLLPGHAGAPRHDARRAGAAVQRREQDRRGSHRRADEELGSDALVRRDRAALDQSVAEHAQPAAGDALSRRRRDRVFERLGRTRHRHALRADWRAVDRRRAARRDAERARAIPGVRFYPVRFTPVSSKYAKEECQGVFMVVTDRAALRPVRLGVELASALHRSTARSTSSSQPSACSDRATSSPAFAPARIRRRSSRRGAQPRRAGGCCARSTCCIAERLRRGCDREARSDRLGVGHAHAALVRVHPLVRQLQRIDRRIGEAARPRHSRS